MLSADTDRPDFGDPLDARYGWVRVGSGTSPFEFDPLFLAVQRQRVFADSKTSVDCIPRRSRNEIVRDYLRLVAEPTFDLATFVRENFIVPAAVHVDVALNENVEEHISTRWRELRREPDRQEAGSSLLPLPYPYVVPGGRFREIC